MQGNFPKYTGILSVRGNENYPPVPYFKMMEKLIKERCDRMLLSLVGEEQVQKWWESPNKAFDDMTPCKQFQIDPLVVYKYLLSHIQY
jgi:hypothetical protein